MGGEHHIGPTGVQYAHGSSPRGRGTHDLERPLREGERFIPAWAGNTPSLDPRGSKAPVHPRVGGEHCLRGSLHPLNPGSSPRGRGTRPLSLVPCPGSSPRGRGTLALSISNPLGLRFIPAWAGNTWDTTQFTLTISVHPRVGGEHEYVAGLDAIDHGSSPRGRGTHGCRTGAGAAPRFIPAWAGNTWDTTQFTLTISVHPRVGGEHEYVAGLDAIDHGSSPRGRGTHGCRTGAGAAPRFIPAWAGNT